MSGSFLYVFTHLYERICPNWQISLNWSIYSVVYVFIFLLVLVKCIWIFVCLAWHSWWAIIIVSNIWIRFRLPSFSLKHLSKIIFFMKRYKLSIQEGSSPSLYSGVRLPSISFTEIISRTQKSFHLRKRHQIYKNAAPAKASTPRLISFLTLV